MPRILPLEIFLDSLKHLSLANQVAVSRSSRSLWNIATPFIWNKVHGVENIVRLIASVDPLRVEHPGVDRRVSPSIIQLPLDEQRALRFAFIARYVRTLHVYQNQKSLYSWPTELIHKIAAAAGPVVLPRLHHLSLSRTDLDSPCHESYHWALLFLHKGIRSIEFPTLSQYLGLDLFYVDAWHLFAEAHDMNVPLTRLSVRCPYTDENTPSREGLGLAIQAITSINSLTSLSITGSLYNTSSLVLLGGMGSLSNLEINGGPLEEVTWINLPDNAFPALARITLRYFDDEETCSFCSIPSVMHSVSELAIEWDMDVEAGSPGINLTVEAIGRECSYLQCLRLGLYDALRARKAHCIPQSVWQRLCSQSMRSVTLLGIVLGVTVGGTYHDAVTSGWPNLEELVVPCQKLDSDRVKLLEVQAPLLRSFVHWDSNWDEDEDMFCI